MMSYILNTATSVPVEHVFSRGRFILPYTHSLLSPQSIHALLYLGAWGRGDMVKMEDLEEIAHMEDLQGNEEVFPENL